MRRRTAIDALRSEAGRRSHIHAGITRFQIVIYAVVVLGIILIADAKASMREHE